jgi:hypothetical protein
VFLLFLLFVLFGIVLLFVCFFWSGGMKMVQLFCQFK